MKKSPGLPSLGRVELYLRKDQRITFQTTRPEKAAMQAAAKSYHLTLTDYLVRLHNLAEEMKRKGRGR